MVRLAVVDPNSPTSRTESVVLRNGKLIPATTEDDLSIVLNVAFCDYLFEAVSIMDDINRWSLLHKGLNYPVYATNDARSEIKIIGVEECDHLLKIDPDDDILLLRTGKPWF